VTERRTSWTLDLGVLLGALVFFMALHPAPGILWFDFSWIAYNLSPLPLTLAGLNEAIHWQASVHSSLLVRPARAIQWWLTVKAIGCSAFGYWAMNVASLSVAVWAITRVAVSLTGSRACGVVVGACLAVSYATVYAILFPAFGVAAACAFGGLLASLAAERAGARQWAWQSLALGLLLVAALSHETFLAYVLLPLGHAFLVRRNRDAAVRALLVLAIFPVFGLSRSLLASVYGGVPTGAGQVWAVTRDAPGILIENSGRVAFATLTGGLPLDPLRALPVFPEFARMRELIRSPAGVLVLALVVAPTLVLVALALHRSRGDREVQQRLAFCGLWLATGSLPLMLPVGTPEAFHLTGALPGLFLVWTEALGSGHRVGRGARIVAVLALAVWAGVHVTARWVLFHHDVPAMTRAVQALHRVLARAQLEGVETRVLFFPAQIGAHYGLMPTVPALYPGGAAGGRACLRGDRPHGCLIEPIWVWSGLRPWPSLPGACRASDGIRVGPFDAAMEREFEGSRRMLSHPATTLGKEEDPRLLATCPLAERDPLSLGGARYALYLVDAPPGSRWYRFSLDGGPALVPIAECGR